jgi:hypothetical protein
VFFGAFLAIFFKRLSAPNIRSFFREVTIVSGRIGSELSGVAQ